MRALKAEGVKTIFGYPGGSIMPVYDALYDYTRGEKKAFDHILVRHEQGATHAAEGFARVSGEVGVALVTSGPGATNTLTGVADAMLDSTPIVVIAGQVPIGALGTDAFQEVDLVGLAQPISKWSYQIRHAEDIAWAVSRAFYIAKSGRPGPVVLDFPKNAQTEKVEFEPVKADFVRSYVAYPKLDAKLVEKAAQLINDAKSDKQGLMVIRQAVRRIRAGDAIGIYPEGTRSKTGELLPFRVGCFKAAQWAKCPLVVLKVENSELVEKNFLRRKTTVRLTVKAVLPYDEIADMDTAEIGNRVREILTDIT